MTAGDVNETADGMRELVHVSETAADRTEHDAAIHNIDEALYSRQLYVMGREAQLRMGASDVLIVGLNGLGVEIAKNVILAGVKSVTLHDDLPVTTLDSASQFYLTEASVGHPRAAESWKQLAELNPYVSVRCHSGEITEDVLLDFRVREAVGLTGSGDSAELWMMLLDVWAAAVLTSVVSCTGGGPRECLVATRSCAH